MTATPSPQQRRGLRPGSPDATAPADLHLVDQDPSQDRRNALRTRHARSLSSLMNQRADLKGVHALADFVDDSVRWSA